MDGRVNTLCKVMKDFRWKALGVILVTIGCVVYTFVSIMIKIISYG